jgi:hypothetical protein
MGLLEQVAGSAEAAERVAKIKAETEKKLSETRSKVGEVCNMTKFEEDLKKIPNITEEEIKLALKEVWDSLPESAKDPLQSPEHLAIARQAKEAIKGLPKTEEKAKGWVESLKKRFPQFADFFPLIGSYIASMGEKAQKENKATAGLYEKLAGWLGYESPQSKFDKFKSGVKLPQGFVLQGSYVADAKEQELTIAKTDGQKVGTLKYNTEDGQITLTSSAGIFVGTDVAEINKNLVAEKLQTPKSAPATAVSPTNPEQAKETEQAKIARLFKEKAGWELEPITPEQEQSLKNGGIDMTKIEDEIALTTGNDSNLKQIYEAIKSVLPKDTVFKFRVTDILYKGLDKNVAGDIVAAIKEKTGKKPEDIRKFLDDAYASKTNIARREVIDTYKKA